jgi:flagellar motor switch protein FliN/FliY
MIDETFPTDDYAPADVPDKAPPAETNGGHGIEFLKDVEVVATVELGSTRLPIREILKLHRGSVVELDRLVGQPVDLLINNTLLAKGEVIVINERFGFRIMKFAGQADE